MHPNRQDGAKPGKENGVREKSIIGTLEVLLMSSISEIQPQDENMIVIAGSHAGTNVAEYTLRHTLRAAFFNDAGNGKDNAGTISLGTFEQKGLPAATVSHNSARIGDAADSLENGVISHVNGPARALGFAVGDKLRDAIERCFAAA